MTTWLQIQAVRSIFRNLFSISFWLSVYRSCVKFTVKYKYIQIRRFIYFSIVFFCLFSDPDVCFCCFLFSHYIVIDIHAHNRFPIKQKQIPCTTITCSHQLTHSHILIHLRSILLYLFDVLSINRTNELRQTVDIFGILQKNTNINKIENWCDCSCAKRVSILHILIFYLFYMFIWKRGKNFNKKQLKSLFKQSAQLKQKKNYRHWVNIDWKKAANRIELSWRAEWTIKTKRRCIQGDP